MNISSKLEMRSVSMALAAVLASIIPLGVIVFRQYIGKYSVLVASSPAAAEISLDGKAVGKTPLTLELKKGTYTLGAKKQGYEPLEHAIYVEAKDENIVNIQLLPAPLVSKPVQDGASAPIITNPDIKKISEEVQKLRSIIVVDPEGATTIPILTEKVLLQGEALKAFRDELKDVREQGKWYLGSMIAIIVGLLGVIASLFISSKSKKDV